MTSADVSNACQLRCAPAAGVFHSAVVLLAEAEEETQVNMWRFQQHGHRGVRSLTPHCAEFTDRGRCGSPSDRLQCVPSSLQLSVSWNTL